MEWNGLERKGDLLGVRRARALRQYVCVQYDLRAWIGIWLRFMLYYDTLVTELLDPSAIDYS